MLHKFNFKVKKQNVLKTNAMVIDRPVYCESFILQDNIIAVNKKKRTQTVFSKLIYIGYFIKIG